MIQLIYQTQVKLISLRPCKTLKQNWKLVYTISCYSVGSIIFCHMRWEQYPSIYFSVLKRISVFVVNLDNFLIEKSPCLFIDKSMISKTIRTKFKIKNLNNTLSEMPKMPELPKTRLTIKRQKRWFTKKTYRNTERRK